MFKNYNLIILLLLISTLSFSQESKTEFKPSGSPIVKVFANYHSNLGGNNIVELDEAMELKRAYFGYKYSISENYSLKVVMDVGNSGGKYSAYLKTGSLSYKKDKLSYNIGLISTTQFKTQEKFWGYRYLRKSFQDQYKYNASADLGMSIAYKFSKIVSADCILQNGDGYKHVDPSGTYRGGVGTTVNFKPITFRMYYDISMKPDVYRQSITSFLGYKFKDKFRIGAEYNYQLNNSFIEDRNMYGYSAYATYIINDKLEGFARFDENISNKLIGENNRLEPQPWNANRDEKIGIIGLQYSPAKGVKVSANYRRSLSVLENSEWVNWVFVNLEFKI